MGKLDKPGYPLPLGDLGDDELVCQLVYLPDRDEYWQAFLAAYHYMTTWQAWERGVDKRGKDAAANWRAAFELTIGCWRMTCLEDLTALLTLIESNTRACWCEGAGDITDGDQYTDVVEDGVGDVPQNIIDAGYAEDAADWDGFADYKCMISHLMVTNMEWQIREFAGLADQTGAILGGAAAIAAIAAVILATGGAALVLGIVIAIAGGSALYAAIAELGEVTLDNLADAVAEHHNALACAIYNGDGSQDASNDLKDEIDFWFTAPEALVLKNLNLPAQLKALYAGRYDQQDVADILVNAGYELGGFSCDCECEIIVATNGGTVIDFSPTTAEIDSTVEELPDRDRVGLRFHWDVGEQEYCEDEVTITSATISPPGGVSRVIVKDRDNNVTYDSGIHTGCDEPITSLNGKDASQITVNRTWAYCGAGGFTLDLVWENA